MAISVDPDQTAENGWPIFHGPVILPSILNTTQWLNIIFLEYESVWPDFWPENKCRSLWLYFMVQWFCLIAWRLSYINVIIWDYESVWPDAWPQSKSMSPWSWSTDFALYLKDYLMDESYFQIIRKCDPTLDLKVNIGQHDLYFMV